MEETTRTLENKLGNRELKHPTYWSSWRFTFLIAGLKDTNSSFLQ
jgi:hypothetical protein